MLTKTISCGVHMTEYFGMPRTLQDLISAVESRAVLFTKRAKSELSSVPFKVPEKEFQVEAVIITAAELGFQGFCLPTGRDMIVAAEQRDLICGPHDFAFRLCLESCSGFQILGADLNVFSEPFAGTQNESRMLFDVKNCPSVMRGFRDALDCQVVGKPHFTMGPSGQYAFIRRK